MTSLTDIPNGSAPPGFWRRMVRSSNGVVGLIIVLGLIFCAAFADLLAPYNPARMGTGGRFLPPGGKFLLGTDEFGRDMLSRILYGSRLTLLIGAVAVGISLTAGMLVGMVAAFRRGWVETLLMRSTDVLFSFTETLIALSFVAVLGPSLQNAVIAVGVAAVPFYARTCYSAALVETSKPYFEASIAAGAAPGRLVFLHLLPNVLPTMIVVATLGVSTAILAAAGLSFLGLGAQPPTSEWGYMLAGSRDYINRAPWLMTIPGLAIAITVLGFNLLGDGLRTSLDPVERR
ncbi:ABC transporter permease [Puniceibacterium sediminis]|uniref:Peptide/nickel transport system permease protein/dipeptide transport system permease protein n=1 Tax=Puniceibacterium sediminis TaxID=1608407 RepID=A0A238X2X8_9RHOB|nr:ABC transporter permease [Puniceibacterium sediminis]SNR53345.1 peptide/nickel transport system permease protein/dipeptide transport system permease protein [Puniceibacterium sediminis]